MLYTYPSPSIMPSNSYFHALLIDIDTAITLDDTRCNGHTPVLFLCRHILVIYVS